MLVGLAVWRHTELCNFGRWPLPGNLGCRAWARTSCCSKISQRIGPNLRHPKAMRFLNDFARSPLFLTCEIFLRSYPQSFSSIPRSGRTGLKMIHFNISPNCGGAAFLAQGVQLWVTNMNRVNNRCWLGHHDTWCLVSLVRVSCRGFCLWLSMAQGVLVFDFQWCS
jgi:hypothetical protein